MRRLSKFYQSEREKGLVLSGTMHLLFMLLILVGLPDFFMKPPPEDVTITVDILPITGVTNVKPMDAQAPHPDPKDEEKEKAPTKAEAPKPTSQNVEPPKPKEAEKAPEKPAEPAPPAIDEKKEAEKKEAEKKEAEKKEAEKLKEIEEQKKKAEEEKKKKEDEKKKKEEEKKKKEEEEKKKKELEKKKNDTDFSKLLDTLGKKDRKDEKAKSTKDDKSSDKKDKQDKTSKSTSQKYDASLPMSLSEKDAVVSQITKYWNFPAGAKDAQNLIVTLHIELRQDGTVLNVELASSDKGRYNSDTFFRAAADSAIRAVKASSPLKDLPQDKYQTWRDMELSFDPRSLF